MDLSSFKQKFIYEAHSLLTNLDNSLIGMEKDPGNRKSIDEVFRVMHTIKGASGMYGFEKLVELTHELETLYDIVRQNNLLVSNQLFDITLNAIDHLRASLSDENREEKENLKHHPALMSEIGSIRITKAETESPNNIFGVTKAEGGNIRSRNILFYQYEDIIRRAVNIACTFLDIFKLGEYKALVESLGITFQNNKMLSGASLLGDGSIALLLDSENLLTESYNNQII